MSARLFALTQGETEPVHLVADSGSVYPWTTLCEKTVRVGPDHGDAAMLWSITATQSLLNGDAARLCRQCDRVRRGLGVLRIVR